MPLIIALSGFHNSGKTTLGTYLVSELQQRGYRVFVLKSTKEEGLLTDSKGSDTWRYRRSGARAVGLLQRDLLTLYLDVSNVEKDELFHYLRRFFGEFDVILLEGFKDWKNIPKIWVLREEDRVEDILVQYKNIELFVTVEDREKALMHILMKLERSDH